MTRDADMAIERGNGWACRRCSVLVRGLACHQCGASELANAPAWLVITGAMGFAVCLWASMGAVLALMFGWEPWK